MAPPSADIDYNSPIPVGNVPVKKIATSQSRLDGPLKYSGSLDEYDQFDVTAVIGREFPGLQLSQILDDDEKLRDLAILGQCLPLLFP